MTPRSYSHSSIARALLAAVRASFEPAVVPVDLASVYCAFIVSPEPKRRESCV